MHALLMTHSWSCTSTTQEAAAHNEEAEQLRSGWTCRICLTRQVDAVMSVCGHVLCGDCARGITGRCPFCRKASGITKLYK